MNEFEAAKQEFIEAIAEELRIHQLINWLSTKIDQIQTYWWNIRLQQ